MMFKILFVVSVLFAFAFGGGGAWQPVTSNTSMPKFRAQMISPQVVVSNVPTKINIDTVTFNIQNAFNVTTHRFQPLVAGYYEVNGACTISTSNQVTYAGGCGIYKNSAQYSPSGSGAYFTSTSYNVANSVITDLVYLNGSTDYIELWGSSYGTGATEIISGTFSAIWIGN